MAKEKRLSVAESKVKFSEIKINSLKDLERNETEILKRIEVTPNGGNLFMIHPFMLLADIGVNLSEQAKKEIVKVEPHLNALSQTPYRALKQSKAKQNVRFHIHGLFRRAPQ